VIGVNNTVDAFMEPFNVTAEYLDRIAKGDTPGRVAEEYRGDFVEVINNLNQCIDTTTGLVAETTGLAEVVLHGRFDICGEAESFGGDYATIVRGINNIVATLVGHIDQIPLPLMILDTDFSINFINTVGAEMLGLPRAQLIGQKCYNHWKTTDCRTANCACDRAMQTKQLESGETTASPQDKEILISYTGIPLKGPSGAIIGALEIFVDQTEIKQAMQAVEQQNWLRTGQAELSNVMRGEQGLTNLAKNVITYLTDYLKADIGTVYLAQGSQLQLLAAHAYTRRNASENTMKLGEGFTGQAAEEREIVLYSDIPDDYLPIKTEFGYEAPNEVLVSPFLYQDELKGVIEVGTTGKFSEEHIEFLKQAVENIAVAVHSAQTRQRMQDLLEQSQQQAEELQAQQEELRVQREYEQKQK
jgi:PAS domain-containing protein/putative methionine-R-sulfoxide reductase with GAF domain